MKTIDGPSKIFRLISLLIVSGIMIYSCYVYHNYCVYSNMKVVVEDNVAVEYGSANYDVNSFIKRVDGEVVSVKNNIDTNVVGEQEIVVEVMKDNIVREFPIEVSVVDTVAPVIQLKEETVVITQGDDYVLTNNVDSVSDSVDGAISYLNEVSDDSNFYYNFSYDQDTIDDVGVHDVVVNAIDKYGNTSTTTFKLEVKEAPKKISTNSSNPNLGSGLAANSAGGDLVSIAYSLIGSPYVSGANGPSAFDCSGFVQYVYSRVGISISRSTSTQIHDGVAVSYENAQPGDILLWGYSEGAPTHSALYVGGGQMVHATNPRQGVIASDVAAWTRGSGTRVIAVRRIQ